MENPLAAAVINDLLDNPDLVQRLLDDARAELHLNDALLAEAAALLRKCLEYEAELRSFPAVATDERRIACMLLVANGASACDFFLKQRRRLVQLIGSLLFLRAVASARSRAHLIPGLFLAAVSAAVLVYVSTWGGVVPGFRSFVRFSVLMLGFLFGFDRPRRARAG